MTLDEFDTLVSEALAKGDEEELQKLAELAERMMEDE